MKNKEVNLLHLKTVAHTLGDLLPHVTFVGGSTTVLLVDESAHFAIRKTDDIDVIIDVATLVEYHKFSQRLRDLGFHEDTEGPICRWLLDSGIGKVKLDVMPVDEKILGFSNRWYQAAINEASEASLSDGTVIRVVTPTYFIATKFEAFAGRGKGDFFSHDLEDIVFVMENRNGLLFELMDSPDELKRYFAEQASLLLNDDFLNVLPGLLNNLDSTKVIINSLNIMRSWS
ncbi:MAG: hypothetical protein KZQ90_19405 [Candidatus Thiodiazotropha sp. (ex Codakia rugifera)]|nr:hypothetical protein [Candidatus Thiodiazotropha sp. (ex Codakia rugifera)]